MNLKYIYSIAAFALMLSACEDLDLRPEGGTLSSDQKEEISSQLPERAEAGVRAIFSQFSVYLPNRDALGTTRHNDFGYPSIMMATDANTADFISEDNGYNWAGNSLTYDDRDYSSYEAQIVWNDLYQIIFNSNNVIATIDPETEEALSQYYLAQGLVGRAFAYLTLAQLYQFNYVGHESSPCVPLITNENSEEAALNGSPRATVQEVYTQIQSDLDLAIQLLTSARANGQKRSDKRYVDLATAYGIRARMNLAMGNYAAAASDATQAITESDAVPAAISDVNHPTFWSSSENNWMWGILIAETDDVVQSGIINWISHCGTFNYGYCQYSKGHQISKSLYNSIPATDVRKGWWTDANGVSANLTEEYQAYMDSYEFAPYTSCKFAPYNNVLGNDVNANDVPLMRIEEMYLIKAEGEAMSGNNGKSTLENFIRTYRDPSYTCTASDVQEEVYRQKRIELWGEGLIWFDVMRLNKGVDRRGAGFPNATSVFNIPAGSDILLWRIPQSEIQANPALTDDDNNPAAPSPTPVADVD